MPSPNKISLVFAASSVIVFGAISAQAESKSQTQTQPQPQTQVEPPPPATPPATSPPVKLWYEQIRLSGDFRLRTEHTYLDEKPSRIRNRYQVRALIEGRVNEDLNAMVRLASGDLFSNEYIVSSNQTMDDYDSKKPVWFDLAYFDWQAFNGFKVAAGRLPNYYWLPGKSQLVWDSDLSFEGGVFRFETEPSTLRLFAISGGYWLNERENTSTDPGPDLFLTASQIGTTVDTGSIYGGLAFGYHTFAGLKASPVVPGRANGNTIVDSKYRYGYDLVEVGFELGTHKWPFPIAIYENVVQNLNAKDVNGIKTDENLAILHGVRIGKIKDIWSWQFDYSYREVESDALVAAFIEGDFAGGNTDARGHKLSMQVQPGQNAVFAVTFYGSEYQLKTKRKHHERTQVDLSLRF